MENSTCFRFGFLRSRDIDPVFLIYWVRSWKKKKKKNLGDSEDKGRGKSKSGLGCLIYWGFWSINHSTELSCLEQGDQPFQPCSKQVIVCGLSHDGRGGGKTVISLSAEENSLEREAAVNHWWQQAQQLEMDVLTDSEKEIWAEHQRHLFVLSSGEQKSPPK